MMSDALDIWTVYFNPDDHPGKYVVRRFAVKAGGKTDVDDPCYVGGSLLEARCCVPPGLYCQTRDPKDQPSIVESWF